MAINYQNLAKSIALRAGQLADGLTAAILDTSYATQPLQTIMQGVDVPYSALKQDILNVEQELVSMIGNSANSQLRSAFNADTEVESGDDIPVYASSGKPYYGQFDGLFNSVTDDPLILMPIHVVKRRKRNAGGFYRLKQDCYALEGTKVYFVCSSADAGGCSCVNECSCRTGSAYFRGCAWNPTAASANFETGESLLPPQMATLWQNMVLARLVQENWFSGEASYYDNLVQENVRNVGLVPAAASAPPIGNV